MSCAIGYAAGAGRTHPLVDRQVVSQPVNKSCVVSPAPTVPVNCPHKEPSPMHSAGSVGDPLAYHANDMPPQGTGLRVLFPRAVSINTVLLHCVDSCTEAAEITNYRHVLGGLA